MRILVVTQALPLYWSSAESRWLHTILIGLRARDHNVTCHSITNSTKEDLGAAYEEMAAAGIPLRHTAFTLREGLILRKVSSLVRPKSEILRVVNQPPRDAHAARPPDVVHYEQLTTSWLAEPSLPSVTICHHLESHDWEGPVSGPVERVRRLQSLRAERLLVRRADHIVTFTEPMARLLGALGAKDVLVAPLVLDYAQHTPIVRPPGRRASVIGMIGSMNHRPSRLAAERLITQIAPRLHAQRPDIRVRIAGWNARKYLGEMKLPGNVDIVDSVPSARDFFASIDVLLYAPPSGTGMKVKVLEALAWGVAVVTNERGREGLERLSGDALPTGSSDQELVNLCLRLLREDRSRVGLMARAELIAKYGLDESLDQLERAYAHAQQDSRGVR